MNIYNWLRNNRWVIIHVDTCKQKTVFLIDIHCLLFCIDACVKGILQLLLFCIEARTSVQVSTIDSLTCFKY
jgi:hypothetical protein